MEHKKLERELNCDAEEKNELQPLRQQWTCMGHIIHHQNQLQLGIGQQNSQKFQIKNRYAFKTGDLLTKVTEIQIEDRILKITDCFTITDISQTLSSDLKSQTLPKQHNPPKQLLTSKTVPQKAEQLEGRGKKPKNVVKNIFRHFETWLKHDTSPELGLYSGLKFLIHSQKQYSHDMFLSLVENPDLRKAFITFCEQQGEEAIALSKIENKRYHLETLRKYHRLCYNKLLQEEIDRHLPDRSQGDDVSFSSIELVQEYIDDPQKGGLALQ